MKRKLYRVMIKTTGSLQPAETFWRKEVIYCGYDRDEAVRVYHESTPTDTKGSYGNPARVTVGQSKEV